MDMPSTRLRLLSMGSLVLLTVLLPPLAERKTDAFFTPVNEPSQ